MMEQMVCLKKEQYVICQLSSIPDLYRVKGFSSLTVTGNEISLVCEKDSMPDTVTAVNKGWALFELRGKFDFSLIGIISGITGVLAAKKIPVIVLSTYDTDYFMVKTENIKNTIDALISAGYPVVQ